ncbi:chordin-like protein 1 [Ptychodera flava]|uniref:chordin-like protein 1 n=1 Tax=Ptychodera flava TaxID=63121 RepID=UPI00396A76B6
MQYLICSLVIFAVLIGVDARPKQAQKGFCTFGERRYSSGDTWHPFLQPIGYLNCITCTCREGLVSCMNIKCPKLDCHGAKPISIQGQCCKTCPVTEEQSDENTAVGDRSRACEYRERFYQHGELFSVDGIFNSRRSDQCVQCSCSDSRVFCALRTCPPVTCDNPVVLPDSCCPVCPDNGEEWEYDYYDTASEDDDDNVNVDSVGTGASRPGRRQHLFTDVLKGEVIMSGPISGVQHVEGDLASDEGDDGDGDEFSELIPGAARRDWGEGENRDCLSNGQVYDHGQSWNPFLFQFGRMNCILCTCRNAKTKCERLSCPSEDELQCENPIKVKGECCRRCPGDAEGELAEESEESECIVDREALLVYEYTPNSAEHMEHTGRHQFVIDNLKEKVTELHKFELEAGEIRDFEIERLSAEEFVQLREQDRQGRFELSGATTEHRLRKLKRQETKVYENCEENCHREIVKLVRALKPREIERRVNLCEKSRSRESGKNDSRPERSRRRE